MSVIQTDGTRVRFHYEDPTARAVCETIATTIRSTSAELLRGIVKVGDQLITAKIALGHGQWGDWLSYQFRMSTSTAENYMNACRAVHAYPELWVGYDPTVLYLFTRSIPESAAKAIVENGPVNREEAQCLISEAKGQEWYEEVAEIEDPGVAHQRIQWAMRDPALKEHATTLLKERATQFAHLSDMARWEVEKDAGVTVLDRVAPPNGHAPQSLYLQESDNGYRLQLWVDGMDPEDVAVLPRGSASSRVWQRAILGVLMTNLEILRTADDIVEVEL